MAIKMSAAELTTFKHNIDLMSPYHDQRLLDRLAKYLYSSSEYNYTIVKGLEQAVIINQIQMYSRHQHEYECQTLCSHIPLKKLYQAQNLGQKYIDQVEFTLYPKRKAIREQNRQQQTELAEANEQKLLALQSLPPPKRVDTSDFPKFAQKLNIYCAADTAFSDRTPPITITIYGLAAAHVVEYIHERYPEIDINVVIINPTITAIMLCLDPDMGARLSNAHTHLFLGNDDTPILHDAIIIPPEVRLAPEINSNLKQRLSFAAERNYIKLLSAKRRRGLNAVLAQYNYPYTKIAPQLQKDTFNHCENIALIFPGPSLSDTHDRLKDLKKNGVRLIACDSALPALEQLKIAPDIIVTADIGIFMLAGPRDPHSPMSATCPRILMNPKFYAKSTMIFTSKTHLLLLALFPSKKYILYTKDMQRRDIPMTKNALVNMDISSCASLMFDLAVNQGAQKIYLFGLDTVTRLDSFHAAFSSEDDKSLINPNSSFDDVPCNDGHMRRALHYFTETRLYLEKKIAANKWINVVNCSPYGAIIKGAKIDDTDTHSLFIAHNARKSEKSNDKQHGKNAKANKQSLGKSGSNILGVHNMHSGDAETATNEALLIAREASAAIRALIDGTYSSGNNGAGDATYSNLTRNSAQHPLSGGGIDASGGKALAKQRIKISKSKSNKSAKGQNTDQLHSLFAYGDEQAREDVSTRFDAEDSSDYDTIDRDESEHYYDSSNRYSSRDSDYAGEDDYGDGNTE